MCRSARPSDDHANAASSGSPRILGCAVRRAVCRYDINLVRDREGGSALEGFGMEYEIDVTSAHSSPGRTDEYARRGAYRGSLVSMGGAGGAAGQAGGSAG